MPTSEVRVRAWIRCARRIGVPQNARQPEFLFSCILHSWCEKFYFVIASCCCYFVERYFFAMFAAVFLVIPVGFFFLSKGLKAKFGKQDLFCCYSFSLLKQYMYNVANS